MRSVSLTRNSSAFLITVRPLACVAATTNTINSSMVPGMIDENFIAHHGAKARGGTGWIGSETWPWRRDVR